MSLALAIDGKARSADFILRNRTHLDSSLLKGMLAQAVVGRDLTGVSVWVRYSRGAVFSGACYYATRRILINLGRENVYPYQLRTNVAPAKSTSEGWRRELYTLEIADAYQLVLFIFLHETYHWLIKRAGRNPRQKEGMCDRFAARHLVDQYGSVLHDLSGRPVRRDSWDIQDLDGFVAHRVRLASSRGAK